MPKRHRVRAKLRSHSPSGPDYGLLVALVVVALGFYVYGQDESEGVVYFAACFVLSVVYLGWRVRKHLIAFAQAVRSFCRILRGIGLKCVHLLRDKDGREDNTTEKDADEQLEPARIAGTGKTHPKEASYKPILHPVEEFDGLMMRVSELTRGPAPEGAGPLRQRIEEIEDLQDRLKALVHQSGHARTVIYCVGDHGPLGGPARWISLLFRTRRSQSRLKQQLDDLWFSTLKNLLALADPEVSRKLIAGILRDFDDVKVDVVNRVAYVMMRAPGNDFSSVESDTREPRSAGYGRSERQTNRETRLVAARTARTVIRICLKTVPGLTGVAVSLLVPMIHPTMGHLHDGCILSVLAERITWEKIVHANVSDENALRNFTLNLRIGSDGGLQEVTPILTPPQTADVPETICLREIDPLAFESIVKDLLTRMGYLASLTKASRDGGIDIEAFNPQPIVGGKVLVQCKRYQDTVGAPTVRELYGVVTARKATKGILVTTSDFSADAYAFAEDNPIELINGERLAELLRRYGFRVR